MKKKSRFDWDDLGFKGIFLAAIGAEILITGMVLAAAVVIAFKVLS